MINSSMKRAEMQASAVNGSEKLLSAADVYCWEDPDFKANPTDMKFFRASDNIAHDCGADPKARFPESLKKELLSLGAVRPETPKGKGREIAQSNPDNPLGITSRKQGFYVPPTWASLNASKYANGAVSVSSNGDGDAEATETPLEPSVNRDVVVEDVERVTPPQIKFSLGGARPAHLQRNTALDKAQVLQALVNLQCSETVVAALSYVGMGWSVLPWETAEGKDGKPRKVPCIKAWNSGGAYNDLLTIPKVFDDGKFGFKGRFYDKQLGIACGATNAGYELVVLDIDVKNGKDGRYAVKALMDKFGSLPNTLTQLTPSGGFHYLFKVPNGTGIYRKVNAFKELGATLDTMEHEKETDRGGGLDVLGFDGYIGASPSVGANGEQYKWLNDAPVAQLPDTWVEAFKVECGKDKVRDSKSVPAPVFDGEAIEMTGTEKDDTRYTLGFLDADDYDDWVAAGLCLKRYGKVGFDLWIEWASSSEKFDPDAHAKRWSGFSGQPTKASIFKLAEGKPGYVNPSTTRAQAAEIERKAVKEAEREESLKHLGAMPEHLKADQSSGSAIPVLGGVDKFPDVVSLREKITTDGVAAWQKFEDGDSPPDNSAKWLALGLLNADETVVVEYQHRYPKTSTGDMRKLVADSKVDWKVATFTVVMHIAGQALLMMGKLEGGFAGLSAASRKKLADLIHDLLEPMPIGTKWKELEATTSTLNLRDTIKDACAKVQNKSKRKLPRSGAKQRSNVSVSSNVIDDAVSAPVAVQNTGFSISNRPIHLGGTSPNPEPHVIRDVSANTVSDAISASSKLTGDVDAGGDWNDFFEAVMRGVNAQYAKVMYGGQSRVMTEAYNMADGRYEYEFVKLRDIAENNAHKRLQIGVNHKGKPIFKDVFSAWSVWAGCRAYRGVVFDPQGKAPAENFNMWRGYTVAPTENKQLLGRVMRHIKEVICDGNAEVYEYVLNWIAQMFQRPWEPAGSALVLRGAKGIGKGVFTKFLLEIIGNHGTQVYRPEHLIGKFNAHLAGNVFLVADEAFFAGDPSALSVLNDLATESTFMLERKGIDPIKHANMLHIVMNTNEQFAVPASSDERRYCVTDVSGKYRNDMEYFHPLIEDTKDNAVQAAFLYEMLNRNIAGFYPAHIPETAALKEQREYNMKPHAKWLMDCLVAGHIINSNVVSSQQFGWNADGTTTASLFDSYEGWCAVNHVRSFHKLSRKGFGAYLYKVFPKTLLGVGRVKGVKLGTLDEAIELFEAHEKVTVD